MPIPMEPMDSIALDVFHYPSTSHDGEVYDRMLLCVCRLSGYLIAIPIPKPRHGDKDEGLTGRRAAHLVMERWVDRFGAPREICSDRGPQFVSQYFQTLCSKIGARLKVLPWVVVGAGGLGAGKTSGAGTRGVFLDVVIGGRTRDTDTNGGESSDNRSKVHADCGPAENPSL